MPVPAHRRFVDPTGPHNVSTVRPPKWHTLADPLDSFAVAIIVERGEPARRRSDYLEAVEVQLGQYLALYPFPGYELGDNDRRDLARRIVDEELTAGGGINVYRGLVLHHLEQLRGTEPAEGVATPDPVAAPTESRLAITGEWLVEETGRHTCGTEAGGHYGQHEPGCGLEPVMRLTELEALLAREGASSDLPHEGVRTLQAWHPRPGDERDELPAHVTADDGLQLALAYDLNGEGQTVPDEAVTFDRPGDLVDLAAAAVDAAVLQLAGSHANGLHLAEGISGEELERRLGALEAAVARLRYRVPVWAAGQQAAAAAFVSSDPWLNPNAPEHVPPF